MSTVKQKVKVAIFDLTDCEGCELQFLAFREKLVGLQHLIEITNWRLAKEDHVDGPFDVAFIEGSPLTADDIEMVKQIRKAAKAVVALGDCASICGIPGIIDGKEREKLASKIYGRGYKPAVKEVYPLGHYIDVDFHLRGCPVTQKELEEITVNLIYGKKVTYKGYPVCLECKARENHCLILEGKPCLGPITMGGCNATCPSAGNRCYGCFGPAQGANIEAMRKRLNELVGKDEAARQLEIFITNKGARQQ